MITHISQKYPNWLVAWQDGQSYVAAVQNAEIVIAEWIETAQLMGRSVPAARGKLVYA